MRDWHWNMSVTAAVAWSLWLIGAGLLVFSLLADHRIGVVGLYVTGLAMVVTNRRMMCKQQAQAEHMFNLGRDVERTLHGL